MIADSTPSYFGKDAATLTPRELQAYDALAYEIEMLRAIAEQAVRWKEMGISQEIENMLVESFALHFRNVSWFLRSKKTKDTDVLARHFVVDPKPLTAPASPHEQCLVDRASREIAHLTTFRRSGRPALKEWNFAECIARLLPLLVDFVRVADPAKCPPRVANEVQRLKLLMADSATMKVLMITNFTTSAAPGLGLP